MDGNKKEIRELACGLSTEAGQLAAGCESAPGEETQARVRELISSPRFRKLSAAWFESPETRSRQREAQLRREWELLGGGNEDDL